MGSNSFENANLGIPAVNKPFAEQHSPDPLFVSELYGSQTTHAHGGLITQGQQAGELNQRGAGMVPTESSSLNAYASPSARVASPEASQIAGTPEALFGIPAGDIVQAANSSTSGMDTANLPDKQGSPIDSKKSPAANSAESPAHVRDNHWSALPPVLGAGALTGGGYLAYRSRDNLARLASSRWEALKLVAS